MKKSKPRGLQAWKLTLAVVAAACVLGVAAVSLSAAAPSYTDWSAPVNLGAGRQHDGRGNEPRLSAGRLEPLFRLATDRGVRRPRPLGLAASHGERRLGGAGEPGTHGQLRV